VAVVRPGFSGSQEILGRRNPPSEFTSIFSSVVFLLDFYLGIYPKSKAVASV